MGLRSLLLALVFASGCDTAAMSMTPPDASDPCDAGANPPTLSKDVEPIFQMHCAGIECHTTFGPGRAYSHLVGVTASECTDGRKLVDPDFPMSSYLIQKVRGEDLCSGVQMPKKGALLSDADVQTISDWICAGAKND